jgi:DNA polymerase-3 subunit alpha
MVRRMMGKKKVDEMEKQKGKFIERSAQHGMSSKDAEALFNQILAFASYCFNRSHSAAYAFVAYQTAYLKCHYPVEYLSALLSSVASEADKTQLYIEEALKKGIRVLPPDINHSMSSFTPDGDNIRFGLASIKQVGEGVIDEIIKEREANGPYKSIYDYIKRVDTKCSNKKTLEGLIKSGAFSSIEKSRKQLWDNIEYITSTASKEAKAKESGQGNLFDMLGDSSAIEDAKFQLAGSDEEYNARTIQNLEKEFLGFYITSHPLSTIRDKLPFLMTHKITELDTLANDKLVTICGLVTSTKQIPTKKDPSKFIRFVTIEDLSGKIENVIAFNNKIAEYGNFLQNEQRVIVSGKVSRREGEEHASLIVETVKTVDNSNIFSIKLLDDFKYEELFLLKGILAEHNGSDPVTFKLNEYDNEIKILTSSMFWVESSNDLVNKINKQFPNRLEIEVRSLDTVEKPEIAAV